MGLRGLFCGELYVMWLVTLKYVKLLDMKSAYMRGRVNLGRVNHGLRQISIAVTPLFVFVLEVPISAGKNVFLPHFFYIQICFLCVLISCPVWVVRKTCIRRHDGAFCFHFDHRDYGSSALKYSVLLLSYPRAR
jgi:hypothetical protein